MYHMAEKVVSINSASIREDSDLTAQPKFQTDTLTIPVKLCNLPPFSSVASQVLALSADPDIDLRQLAFVMEADPAFAAEILLLANSSLFGFTSRMSVLRHAIAILGLDRIRALAVTVAMRAFLGQGGPQVRRSWQHSAASAVIAEEISAIFDFSGDRAYTAALMHDVGRLGLVKSYSREMSSVMTAHYAEQAEVLAAERAAVQVDHTVAGAWLVTEWAYPPSFAQVCEHHHEPPHPKDPPLLWLVKVACRMADALGYTAVPYQQVVNYPGLLTQFPSPLQPDMFPTEEELRKNVRARLEIFELQP